MAEQWQIPRNRIKTRTGCSRCKQRRIKCDESHPDCNNCTRRGFECPGYKRPLKWSSKYEFGGNGTLNWSESRIRSPRPTSASGDPAVNTFFEGCWSGILTPNRSPLSIDPNILSTTQSENVTPSLEAHQNFNLNFPNERLPIQPPDQLLNPEEWDEWLNDGLSLHIPMPLEDEDTGISRHYFVQVCRINSCVDSEKNFFRAEITSLMASSPLLYHCVLSMSAAHLTGLDENKVTSARDHRTKAHSSLQSAILNLSKGKREEDHESCEILLGSILLGMTDSWHNPSFLGTTHLHGARAVFKRWILPDNPKQPEGLREFITGVMVYWEAMSSFVVNQSFDEISYLDNLCDHRTSSKIYLNPWTGISTPLFVYLAKVGTLARQRLLLKQLSTVMSQTSSRSQIHATILQSARDAESALISYLIPKKDEIEDPIDPVTTVTHLQRIAQIYRLSALVELYRNFPDLLQSSSTSGPTPASKTLAIAASILNLIATIPHTSGVTCLLTIPLVIAGSTLQHTQCSSRPVLPDPSQSGWDNVSTELVSIAAQGDVQKHWRGFVQTRLQEVRRYVGLAPISRASEILEKVWARSDIQAAVGGSHRAEFVQWVEVMVEERLETILG
ncbi:fungal-specific transcription factor domain-containing protein [Aspergillus multicolor]|uniref:Zn(II)2Cys6 transcription factor n=1 Tax=Aspergillus multicolor TaxID=41759 RepID=UPI003CCCC23F